MGYRSKVAVKCQINAFALFKEAYEKESFYPDKLYVSGDGDEREILMVWNWVKWDEGIPQVKAIEDVIENLNELNPDEAEEKLAGYKQLLLGEDDCDVESYSNSTLELYYIREFDTEGMTETDSDLSRWIRSDDLQRARKICPGKYELIEANESPEGGFLLSEAMVINLPDYVDSDGEYTLECRNIISGYYGGCFGGKVHDPVKDFKKAYPLREDRDQVLAEMIYECTSGFLPDYPVMTEEEAVKVLDHYEKTGEYLELPAKEAAV